MPDPDATPTHPSEDLLRAFSLGELGDDQLEGISAHLNGCQVCCARIDDISGRNAFLTRLQSATRSGDSTLEGEGLRRQAARALQREVERRRSSSGSGWFAPSQPSVSAEGDGEASARASAVEREQPPNGGEGAEPACPRQIGDYDVLAEVGRGGMGVVYRARDRRLNRQVALKVMLAGQFASPTDRLRFRLEAELAARVQHPNIVQVYEVGLHESPPFLAMEWVEGCRLADRLDGRPWPVAEAARLVETLARAIHAVHLQGVIHRDLKPANILLQKDEVGRTKNEPKPAPPSSFIPHPSSFVPKIADFGLARVVQGDGGLTRTGFVAGTPEYMAPEQARGEVVGPAVDVYALGAILYELLSGRAPFVGDTPMAVVMQASYKTPARLSQLRPGIPRDLEVICLKCLEKEPHQRYLSAADLAGDLECLLGNRPIRARPAGIPERAAKWVRRHPLPAALLFFLALSLVLGSAASTYFGVTAMIRATEAQNALGKEGEARVQAEQATRAERWQRYLAEIAAASNALQLHNIGPARRALEAAPADHRNWEWRHLHSQLDGARAVLRGHDAPVGSLAFSPDGKRVASSGDDQTVRVWDTATGKEVAILRAPLGGVGGVRFSPDGSRLVTGGTMVRLWDAATGELRWEVAAGQGQAPCPRWSPDGRLLANSEGDAQLYVRDAATGREVFRRNSDVWHSAVAFSPDGRYVAVNGADYFTIRVWEATTGKEAAVLHGHTSPVTAIAYSPDGRRLASASTYPENAVRLWDVANGKQLNPGKGTGHANEVRVLAFRSDGRRLASGSMDQTVRLWDGVTGEPLATLEGHTNFVNDLAFSPDGAGLLSASSDQTLRLWDTDAYRLTAVLHGHTGAVSYVQYDPVGALLASSSQDHTVRLWDAALVARNGVVRGHTSFVYDVAFCPSPQRNEIASAGWDGLVRLWDPTTGQPTAVFPHQSSSLTALAVSLQVPFRCLVIPSPPQTSILTALAYSPDGRQLAVVAGEEGVWLWDLAGRKRTHLWQGSTSNWKGNARPAFHPDGTLLAAGSLEGLVRLWDPATGDLVGVLTGHEGCSWDGTFRPDGKQLATAGEDGKVRLWDVATRRQEAVLPGSPDMYRLAYSADGRFLAAGSADKTVRVWSVPTHEELGQVALGSAVYGVAFSPDGTRLACGCADNTIRLLDVARLQEVAELRGHSAYVHAVGFSPDGTRLISGSGDFTVRVWDTLPIQARAEAGPR
jgi:eukaryotic-like serine/threonine-protein kinase